jgi:integrase
VPLRVRSRQGTSALWLIGTIKGRRIRESTGTADPAVAETIRAAREAQLLEDAIFGRSPTVPFRQAADHYMKWSARGHTQKRVVDRLVKVLGHRPTRDIGQRDADLARLKLCRADAKPATVIRNVVSPLSAILRHAKKRQWCEQPDLDWPKVVTEPPNPLTPAQAEALIAAAAAHLKPIITFLFTTGARSGEALALEWPDVDLLGRRVIFWEHRTKTGKRRVVDLNPRAVAALAALPHRTGRVFRRDDGEPYTLNPATGSIMRSAWIGACIRAGLPAEPLPDKPRKKHGLLAKWRPLHTPHDARHSWASWDYCVNRDLLGLRDRGGWASTSEVETYAHLMPAGEADSIRAFWGLPRADTPLTQPKRKRA